MARARSALPPGRPHKVATSLGQEQFQRAYAKGTALSLDKALALASGKARHQR